MTTIQILMRTERPCRRFVPDDTHRETKKAPGTGSGASGRKEQMDRWLKDRGVTLIGADLDESPMAYRRLPEVIAQHAGTVKVLHTLRPFAVAMAGTRRLQEGPVA